MPSRGYDYINPHGALYLMLPILALLSNVYAYGSCQTTAFRFANQNVNNIPFVGTSTKSIMVNNVPVSVEVSGTVSVVDKCSFMINGLRISGPTSIQFFGGVSESDGQSVRLVGEDVAITSNGINGTFQFIQTAGNWVNYNDFRQINIYDPVSKTVLAQAVLPGNPPSASATAVATARTTPTSSVALPTQTSDATSTALGFVGIVSLLMTMF